MSNVLPTVGMDNPWHSPEIKRGIRSEKIKIIENGSRILCKKRKLIE